jgi:flagellar protein FliO/FliZ
MFFDTIRMLLPLLLITALLGGVLWFIRRYSYQARANQSLGIDIKVLSSKMILPKKYISVIKVKDRILVLGVSEGSINLLKEFDVSPEDEITFNEPGKENFIDVFKKNLNFK